MAASSSCMLPNRCHVLPYLLMVRCGLPTPLSHLPHLPPPFRACGELCFRCSAPPSPRPTVPLACPCLSLRLLFSSRLLCTFCTCSCAYSCPLSYPRPYSPPFASFLPAPLTYLVATLFALSVRALFPDLVVMCVYCMPLSCARFADRLLPSVALKTYYLVALPPHAYEHAVAGLATAITARRFVLTSCQLSPSGSLNDLIWGVLTALVALRLVPRMIASSLRLTPVPRGASPSPSSLALSSASSLFSSCLPFFSTLYLLLSVR